MNNSRSHSVSVVCNTVRRGARCPNNVVCLIQLSFLFIYARQQRLKRLSAWCLNMRARQFCGDACVL